MATNVSITTSYAGEAAGKYVSAALLSADTLEGGGVTLMPNVKFKSTIQKVATADLIQDASCDFTPTGSVTLTERVIQPEEYQINLQLCKQTFQDDWSAISMGYSAFDSLPPSFADFIIGHVAAKVAEKMENNIWQGTDSNAGEFDGFTALFAADSDVLDVVTSETSIDSTNVIGELGKVVDRIPTTIYGKEDLYIYVASNVARAYVRALGGFGSAGLGGSGVNAQGTTWYNGGDLAFDGVKIFVAPGLPDNHMVAAQKSNLFFGTGLMSDMNEVKLLDLADIDGSQNCRIVMRFTAGIQYGLGAEVVYYSI